jgi:hypothetical protein
MASKANTDEGQTEINATVSVQKVVSALMINDTNGADDRVIAIPQRDGTTAKIRRAFRGSERYSNPESAPVHITPESLVDEGWTRPPRRDQVDYVAIDVPKVAHKRDEEDEQRIDEAHDVMIDVWRTDICGMIQDEHEYEAKGCSITLTGKVSDE